MAVPNAPGKRITYTKIFPYLLIAPVLIYVLIFLVFPFFYGIGISLTDKKIGSSVNFIGLKNYVQLLKEQKFVTSIKNTMTYTVISVLLKVILGMAMALVLNANLRWRALARGLLLIPWAVPTTVSIYVWKWM
ncbi:MAG: sugar ABC transporter permease, partial [Lachnospiraceae bacterium]|nr:sugar ABC transporter permease [Lachnospiraceae bacterium]